MRYRLMKQFFLVVVFVVLLLGSVAVNRVSATIIVPGAALFERPQRYDYAPSVMQDGNIQKFWWCGYGNIPGTQTLTDVILYRSYDFSTSQWSPPLNQEPTTVLWPTNTTNIWDGKLTCDPSVIKGSFYNPENGQTYSYAMYYTGTNYTDGTNGRVGLAYSNDGVHWRKYSQPVIYPRKFPLSPSLGDCTATTLGFCYGAGEPATYNYNGQSGVFLFHTDSSYQQTRMWVRSSTDGINFSNPTLISNQGVPLVSNSDFGYDYNSGYFYAAIQLPLRPTDRATYQFAFARMNANQLLSGAGVWEDLGHVDTTITNYYLNHSPGLLKDPFGNVSFKLPTVQAYFAKGDNDPLSWDLTWAAWQP